MVVSWQAFDRIPYGLNQNPQSYRLSPESLNTVAMDGFWFVYNTRNISCISNFYNIELLNLTSSITYYYRIVKSTCADAFDIYSFQTAPETGNQSRPINITIFGNLGVEFLLNVQKNRKFN
jgi:hypothetical protein